MKMTLQLILLLALLLSGHAYAHDRDLAERLITLEQLSMGIARETRRARHYDGLAHEAQNLAREARRLSQMIRSDRYHPNVRHRYRSLDRQFQSLERQYRALNQGHRRPHIHRDYLSLVGVFGDIRVIYRRGESADKGYFYQYDRHDAYRDRQYDRRAHHENRQRHVGRVFSRKYQREYSGSKRFDREDRRRNHYRQ